MSGHTKGPWKVMRRANQTGMKSVAVVSIPVGNVPVADVSLRNQDAEANAYLIAAAPELLEALKGLDAHMEASGVGYGPVRAAAREAIAKAEGI